jgi:KAP family P-loop domain
LGNLTWGNFYYLSLNTKPFFDIEGIIYVIGMDPTTIDPIIQVKYGQHSKISGLAYMKKVAQLPFHTGLEWRRPWMNNYGNSKRNRTSKDITDKLLEQEIKDMIINSASCIKFNTYIVESLLHGLITGFPTAFVKLSYKFHLSLCLMV